MIRVAINGFGRIGRQAAKIMLENDDVFKIVAVNDLTNPEALANLLKYDSVYGLYEREVSSDADEIIIDKKKIKVYSEKDPADLPWKEDKIDVVIESTGLFTKKEDAAKHISAGAKNVVISAPSKGDDPAPTFLRGVNDDILGDDKVINNASCTTNCIAPTIQVLHDAFGVKKALMTTVHGYTADQNLQDGPHRDYRRARAAGLNIVPTSTGAAIATTQVIPELKGVFDGTSLRVPVPVGSISDITAVLKKEATVDQINSTFEKAAKSKRYQGVLDVTREPLVSSDIIGNSASAIVDLSLTQVVEDMVKVFAWYDNEFGYANRLVEMVQQTGK